MQHLTEEQITSIKNCVRYKLRYPPKDVSAKLVPALSSKQQMDSSTLLFNGAVIMFPEKQDYAFTFPYRYLYAYSHSTENYIFFKEDASKSPEGDTPLFERGYLSLSGALYPIFEEPGIKYRRGGISIPYLPKQMGMEVITYDHFGLNYQQVDSITGVQFCGSFKSFETRILLPEQWSDYLASMR